MGETQLKEIGQRAMKLCLAGCILTIAFSPLLGEPPQSLRQAVESYWTSMARGDFNAALELVDPDSRNAFIKQQKSTPYSWEILGMQALEPGRFAVQVKGKSLLPGQGRGEWMVTDNWVLQNDQWRLLVTEASNSLRRIWQGSQQAPKRGVVEVTPRTLKIHFISPDQSRAILVRNGLEEDIRLVQLQYDSRRLDISHTDLAVPAGQVGRLLVRHTGEDEAKNQETRVALTLQTKEGRRLEFSVPVTYNYISRGTRALLGLTKEQAEQLTREQVFNLQPALQGQARGKTGKQAKELLQKKPEYEELS